MRKQFKYNGRRAAISIVTAVMAFVSLIPLLVLLQLAFHEPSQLTENGFLSLQKITLQNFPKAFESSNLFLGMRNSVVIAVVSLILTVFFSSAASYEIARFPSKFNSLAYMLFLFSMAIPSIISTVPLYILMRKLGAVNTRWGMILLNTAFAMPFAVFLYTSFIKSMTRDMEEAAKIDGCSAAGCFFKVLFPIMKPVTSTVILLNAVTFWNEYGRAVFFLQKQSTYTMPLSISLFIQKYGADWELMAAASLVALVPVVTVFLAFQKYYIKGLAAGAVKG